MQKNSSILLLAAIVTIAVVTTAKQFFQDRKCDIQSTTIHLDKINLPYKTELGTTLSLNAIPRGKYRLSQSQDISQVELSAVMLDPSQNLIKTVLMIGGDFADDSEFELTDSLTRGLKPIPAKVIDRLSILPIGFESKFIYLFASPQLKRWHSKKVVVIELDDTIPTSRIYIRKVGSADGNWVEGHFIRTNEPIDPIYARANTITPNYSKSVTPVYGLPNGCSDN